MSDSIHKVLAATPILRDLPLALQVPTSLLLVLVLAVALNVANQLLVPKPKSLPPVVFHWFPWIGSAVSYGMDPYVFFFECKKKVRSESCFSHLNCVTFELTRTCLPPPHLESTEMFSLSFSLVAT